MKRAILFLAISALIFGCNQHRSGSPSQPVTQTIAPAEAKPAPSSGTDSLTQTVDLGDGRSEAEAGGSADGTTTTAPPPAQPAKKAPAKKKHK